MSNSDVYDFLANFNSEHGGDEGSYGGESQNSSAQMMEPPEIQPCEYGFECNNCGYCH